MNNMTMKELFEQEEYVIIEELAQIVAKQQREIYQLQDELDELPIDDSMIDSIDNYFAINKHGFTTNLTHEPKLSHHNPPQPYDVETSAFSKWKREMKGFGIFPPKSEVDVNWNKPMKITLGFSHVETIDLQNLQKTLIDAIFNHYREDDAMVKEVHLFTVEHVDSFNDGKMFWKLENIDFFTD
jgi:Holliday junction resolvase RusA-like endonuclease